jgi:hypothetical protein
MDREQEYRDCAEAVARELLGEPNQRQSNGVEIRWGTHGSLSLKVARGIFHDHENGEGGGVRWLVKRECGLDNDGITAWLVSRHHITADEPREKIVATYGYVDATGRLLYQVVRYEPKTFKQRKPDGNGCWDWNVRGVRQVPYRLLILVNAVKLGQPVFITEGEKDVDNLATVGVVATCNAGGAGKWPKALNEHFRGADVILIPDNDKPGYDHINVVGKALTAIAKRIRVLLLPVPEKGDVSDWLAAGGTAEALWSLVEQAPDWVEAGAAAEGEKARFATNEQWLIDELARLSDVDYDRRRNDAADELGVRRATLDNERSTRREAIAAERGPAPLFGHWVVEPWPEPVDGDALLSAIVLRIRRHVILTNDQATAVAAWVLMSWVHQDAATHSPILLATSAEANSGKTTLIGLISFMVPRGMNCVGISEAALYRIIEMYEPTILVDEADVILSENEALRAVINSGWTRGSGVPRCTGDNNTPHLFPTFAPKVIGMKGRKLPDTTLSRCVTVEMKRKKSGERAEHFRHIDDTGLSELRQQCMRWSIDNIEALKPAVPKMPSGFENRLGDNWSLMLAVTDLAGGEWAQKARGAAIVVSKAVDIDDLSLPTQLLADVRLVFSVREDSTGAPVKHLSSADLAEALGSMSEQPWSEWKGGKFTPRALATLLRPFNIYSGTIRTGAALVKGYQLSHFQDAFQRYLGDGHEERVDANVTL